MKRLDDVPYTPVNAQEHMLYAMTMRLEALCHMVSSLVEHIAERDGVSVELNQIKQESNATPRKTTRKKKEG